MQSRPAGERWAPSRLPVSTRSRLWWADAVWALHTAITAFFCFAWALPWRTALWIAVLGAVVMQLQWWLNDGLCVLTKLERKLRGPSSVPAAGQRDFIGELAARLAGRALPQQWTDSATYAVLWGGAGIAALRLAWA